MACVLHGLGARSSSLSGGGASLLTTSKHSAQVPLGRPGKTSARIGDFWSATTPPFMIGPGNGKPHDPPGPGACFGCIDNGNDCAGLSQLEVRLYHEHTMKPKPRTMEVPEQGVQSGKLTKAALAASASSPTLGAKGQSPSQPKGESRVPYPYSEVGSDTSEWKKHYVRIAPPGLSSRGLIMNDLTYAHSMTPGVCVQRIMALPKVAHANDPDAEIRIQHVDNMRRRCEKVEAKRKERNARPVSPGGSSQGATCEVLPKAQHRTRGRASICKPLPADLTTSDQRKRYSLAPDSLCTSEHRSSFWWKGRTEEQMDEIKQFGQPRDANTEFRDNAAKSNVSLFPKMEVFELRDPRTRNVAPPWGASKGIATIAI